MVGRIFRVTNRRKCLRGQSDLAYQSKEIGIRSQVAVLYGDCRCETRNVTGKFKKSFSTNLFVREGGAVIFNEIKSARVVSGTRV